MKRTQSSGEIAAQVFLPRAFEGAAVTIVRVGSNPKLADGWELAFTGKKGAKAAAGKPAKKTAKKAPAKKAAAKKAKKK